jgi:chromosomal replication initiation ATPase DnaA
VDTTTEPGRLIAERLKAQLGPDFLSWFQSSTIELIDDRVIVTASTRFAAHFITNNLADAVRSAAAHIAGRPVTVTVVEHGQVAPVDVAPIEKILRAVAPDDAQRDFFIPELS